MPDVLPIRASEEMQARFREFTASGDFRTQTDFFNHLLTLYAAQETGVRVPTLEGAVTAVNELTDRINKILIGAGETISANQEKEKAQIESVRHEADQKTASLTAKNEQLAAALEEQKALTEEQQALTEKVKKELNETQEHEKKLDQMLDDKSALIDEYREKIDSLETEISRQRMLVTEATDDRAELETLRIKIKEQDLQIERMTLEKEKALNDQKAFYTEKISATTSEYESAIRQKELEIGQIKNLNDKALIDLEMKLRKEINDRQTEYGKSIKDYEKKVYTLLEKFENSKTPETKK